MWSKNFTGTTYDLSGKVPVLEHQGAILNLNDASLTYNGEKIDLTKNEFRILQTLMENKGRLVSRDTLMTRLWETQWPKGSGTYRASPR